MKSVDMVLSLLDVRVGPSFGRAAESFQQFDSFVTSSLVENTSPEEKLKLSEDAPKKHFQLASRLHRPNYEDQMKAEALISAIQKLREKNDLIAKSRNSS